MSKKKKIGLVPGLRQQIAAKDWQIRSLLAGRDMRDEEIRRLANMANNAARILVKLLEEREGRYICSLEELEKADPARAKVFPVCDGKVWDIRLMTAEEAKAEAERRRQIEKQQKMQK